MGKEEVEVIVNQIINKTRTYDSHINIESIEKSTIGEKTWILIV